MICFHRKYGWPRKLQGEDCIKVTCRRCLRRVDYSWDIMRIVPRCLWGR